MLIAFIALIALVVVLALALFLAHRRHLRRRAEMEAASFAEYVAQRDGFLRMIDETAMQHREQISRTSQRHHDELAAQQVDTANAMALVERYHQALTRTISWETGSRTRLLEMLTKLPCNGVLFSGVTFLAGPKAEASLAGQFVTQLDHVLLLEHCIVVIEAKNWRDVVFDGVDPRTQHPALGLLMGSAPSAGEFAVHMKRESPSRTLSLRWHDGIEQDDSARVRQIPRVQVRGQAARLRQHVELFTGEKIYVEACVFYSHPDVILYAAGRESSAGKPFTPALDSSQMPTYLAGLANRSGAPSRSSGLVASVAPALALLATDATGIGTYAQAWTSVLDAHR